MVEGEGGGVPVIRTDFSDEPGWQAVCAAMQAPDAETGCEAYLALRSDRAFAGSATAQIVASFSPEPHGFVFVVDTLTLTHPERPILMIDLAEEPGRSFRVIPSEVAIVAANLSIANMDFYEYAEYAEATWPDGIHRGFH